MMNNKEETERIRFQVFGLLLKCPHQFRSEAPQCPAKPYRDALNTEQKFQLAFSLGEEDVYELWHLHNNCSVAMEKILTGT